MAVIIKNSFEGVDPGTTVTTFTTAANGQTAAASAPSNAPCGMYYGNQVAATGENGVRMLFDGVGAAFLRWNVTVNQGQRMVTRFYTQTDSFTVAQRFLQIRNASGVDIVFVSVSSSGVLSVSRSGVYTLNSQTGAFPLNKLMRIEIATKVGSTSSNGVIDVALYEGHSTIPIWQTSASSLNLDTAAIASVTLGSSAAPFSARTVYFDDLTVVDDQAQGFIGPSISKPPYEYTFSGSNGSAWSPEWSTYNSGGGQAVLQSNTGVLSTTGNSGSWTKAHLDGLLAENVEVDFTMDLPASTGLDQEINITINAAASLGLYGYGYRVTLFVDTDGSITGSLSRQDETGTSQVATGVAIAASDTSYKVRMRRYNSKVFFKLWPSSQVAPNNWQIVYPDAVPLDEGSISLSVYTVTQGVSASVSISKLIVSPVDTGLITVVNAQSVASVGDVNASSNPPVLSLTAPTGMIVYDYYLVAMLFAQGTGGSPGQVVTPKGFTLIGNIGTSANRSLVVFGRPVFNTLDINESAVVQLRTGFTTTRVIGIGIILRGVDLDNPVMRAGEWMTAGAVNQINVNAVPGDAEFYFTYSNNIADTGHPQHFDYGENTQLIDSDVSYSGASPSGSADSTLSVTRRIDSVGFSVTVSNAGVFGVALRAADPKFSHLGWYRV